ncbi:nickel pincer cofactor biosynthesis protein LarC [Spirulina major CS-329]|uniref:nickel pincer cofactor biosynthesis protein LarC n=1 Tax=Spirulina TaxID=1154 RepID=UPI0023303C14|nr:MULTISPECIES: nickel pincer cofactor biosynthesis protein LarC [Spirulina]MDB9494027.1 nickel pincer cofactor biosynthesis protein LarC [Spirulina subsalsa CS-330]MDB9502239.1 nickel pincer cofactor biosynthesis protein LarC [Spirulina major CS-329]
MTKIAYFDCPTGIAGDMCLGALVDLGVPLEYLIDQLHGLGMAGEYRLRSHPITHHGQQGTKVHVDLQKSDHPPHRHLPEITALIQGAKLPRQARDWSLQVFEQLAIAEGAVHGIPPETVHFHEVGAVDAIVDIVGTCIGLDWLGVSRVYCSALPTGSGTVKAAHGRLPVPVPAVLKLWETRHVPIYSNDLEGELVTPTGAALMVTLAQNFGTVPPMQIQKTGWGAGTKALPLPNMVRVWIGTPTAAAETGATDPNADDLETVIVLETQIDDASPQAIAYAQAQLFTAGALDVFTQGIQMKKSRLGTLITVICPPAAVAACEAVLFQETPTLGIRRSPQRRRILARRFHTVTTPYGDVTLKIASQGDRILNIQPEYEDCATHAQAHGIPWHTVHQAALTAWEQHQ